MPLTLTILSAAVPAERRGLALGAWGGISGLAVAIGPLVGGAVVSGISWHWIFWLNVPIGVVIAPLALSRLRRVAWPDDAARPPRGCARERGSLRDRLGARPRQLASAGARPRSSARSSPAWRCWGLFVWWELRTDRPDAADALLPQPDVRVGERRKPAHVLRDVRLDLPARTVLPDRPGLLAAAVRPTDPAVDGDADLRRPDRRRALGQDRRAYPDGRRAHAAGGRARVDRGRVDADHRRTRRS